jgi:aminopeptidase-like protein
MTGLSTNDHGDTATASDVPETAAPTGAPGSGSSGAGPEEMIDLTGSDRVRAGEAHRLVGQLLSDLFPLCRSITGHGNRATLRRLAREVPLVTEEVRSGVSVLDWTVPPEWNLRRATLRDPDGTLVADTENCNLHLVGYSRPIRGDLTLDQLGPHLHSVPDAPTAVPYRTAYYADTWGFCLSQQVRDRLRPGRYQVEVDTTIQAGSLSYGELVVPGATDREILVSTHICHPSMANDNLSGIAVAVLLARWALAAPRRRTYRFLFVPGTIGSITWLAMNPEAVDRVAHGLVLTGLGDDGPITYKPSRRGDTSTDRVLAEAVGDRGAVLDWYPYGYDERQYSSPGFDLPVGRLSRRVHGTYPEYHTSLDDLDFVSVDRIVEAAAVAIDALEELDRRRQPVNLSPRGEPQLGRRGLFSRIGGALTNASAEASYLWLLALADGDIDLTEMAERSGLDLDQVEAAAERLAEVGLLTRD